MVLILCAGLVGGVAGILLPKICLGVSLGFSFALLLSTVRQYFLYCFLYLIIAFNLLLGISLSAGIDRRHWLHVVFSLLHALHRLWRHHRTEISCTRLLILKLALHCSDFILTFLPSQPLSTAAQCGHSHSVGHRPGARSHSGRAYSQTRPAQPHLQHPTHDGRR